MNILREYTFDFIRRNKRSSIAIMIAILLTTTMMSSLCGFLYTIWNDSVRLSLEKNGDWHGELFDKTYGSDLSLIENFASVDKVMVKGKWYVGKIDDIKRDYIVYRDATSEYWKSMSEKNSIMEGRVPNHPGEIALSKQYFENHPDFKVGDTLTLPIGNRISNGKAIEPTSAMASDENFTKKSEEKLTVVGKLDVATSSVVPAYTAIGYLDRASIKPNDDITVYLRFKNIRDTYNELPKLASLLGWDKNEYGDYNLKYNSTYLLKMMIFSPKQKASMNSIQKFSVPIMYGTIALFTVAVFVMVIYNAFALSSNARLNQLGILASIGASPKQIKKSVIFEGFILTVIPLPIGLFLGYILCKGLVDYINVIQFNANEANVVFVYGLPAALPAVILALLTVWISALIPAKKISKLSPIEAILQADSIKIKKPRSHPFAKIFGVEGELAANAFNARKKYYKTATISLTLSFIVLAGFLNIIACQKGAESVYGSDLYAGKRDISLALYNGTSPDNNFLKEAKNVDGIKSTLYYLNMKASIWLTEKDESAELKKNGGFNSIVSSKKYALIERNGKFRINTSVIGLDDDSFTKYCTKLSINPSPYYDKENPSAIVYNREEDINLSTRRNKVYINYLKLSVGDKLTLNEKSYDEDKGDYTFDMRVGHIASELPPIPETQGRYTIVQIVPMSMVQEISKNFDESNRLRSNMLNGVFLTDNYDIIPKVREKLTSICEKYYGSGDYEFYDVVEREEFDNNGQIIMNLIVTFITGLLATIGLSNVWATVSGNLRSRRREFAMLRSAGLSPRGMKKMLVLEALFFGLTPLLLSIPVQFGILYAFLKINEITFMEYLPFAQILILIGFTVLVILVIALSYVIGNRQLEKENIVQSIKNETM